MKYFLLFSIIISSSAFAIDFNKATGTFDVEEKANPIIGEDSIAATAFGSFNLHEDKSRAPASVEQEVENRTPGTNDVTGTFQ